MSKDYEILFQDLDQERFQYIKDIGDGTDGVLALFNDKKIKQNVAIKLLKANCRKKEILNELFNMRHLSHRNIIQIRHVILKRVHIQDEDKYELKLFYVMKYWPSDLSVIIRSYKTNNKKFNLIQIKKIMYQILDAFNYLCQKKCFHRDIKPNNILIDQNLNICITDFGRSKIVQNENEDKTAYVFVKFYRAPEITILEKYDLRSEIWALGWIFYELITLDHPLKKAVNRSQLFKKMLNLFGTPKQQYINQIKEGDERRQYFESFEKIEQKNISDQIENFDKQGIDLLDKMLCFDYRQRIGIQEALLHPFFKEFNHGQRDNILQSGKQIDQTFQKLDQTEDIDQNLIITEVNLLNKFNNEKSDYIFDELSIVAPEEDENSYILDSDLDPDNTDDN